MERINTSNACHFFMPCHADRPKARYAIDFSKPESLDYIPMMRMRCGTLGMEIFRPDWRMPLNSKQLPFVLNIDGRRTIREIAACAAQGRNVPQGGAADFETFGRELFQSLWRLDFISMIPNTAG
jgi:hypothetical protein